MFERREPNLTQRRGLRAAPSTTVSMGRAARPIGWPALLLALCAVLLGSLLPAAASAAAQPWTARLGTAGRYGTVTVRRSGSGASSVVVGVRNLRAGAAYDVRVNRGSCTVPGRAVTTPLLRFRSSRTGTFSRTAPISGAKGAAILAALAAGPVAIRVGTHCGYLTGGPTPTPTPTPTPAPGLGVPVIAPDVELIVLAAEPWAGTVPGTDPADTLVTVQVWATGWLANAGPDDLVLRDRAGADHVALAGGRTPALIDVPTGSGGTVEGWVTFAVPTADATDVTLRWTVQGTTHGIPLHVDAPPVAPLALSLATTSGLEDAQVSDAVGTPGGYVAVGWTEGPAPGYYQRPGAWTSADGLTWKKATLPALPAGSTAMIYAIARGGAGRLVAAGNMDRSAVIWTSADDGATWTREAGLPTDSAASGGWSDVTALGSGFVVVGSVAAAGQYEPHAAAMTSTDGLHWTRSTSVEAANCRGLDGVLAGGPGLIGWGTLWDCDTVAYGATAWWSATGATWTRAPDAVDFVSTDTGGATARAMKLVFGGDGDWTAIATWSDTDGRPLVYGSADGKTWAPRSVGASLRRFWPAAATADGDSWLLGGFGVSGPGSPYSYEPQAWLGAVGDWLRVPVEVPDPPANSTAEYRITAFADGPAGRIAIGFRSGDAVVDPVGAVWTIAPRP